MRSTQQLGKVKIHLPNENSKQFYIFQDLAELFGEDYQGDAVSKLRKALKNIELKPKPNIDYEADNTSIRTTNSNTIFQVAKTIHDLTLPNNGNKLSNSELEELLTKLNTWKRPKPQKWKVGDIFSFKLKDEYCFGQIVGDYPTCALLNIKSSEQTLSEQEFKNSKALTTLHLTPNSLNDFTWKVIQNSNKLVCSKDAGPWGSDQIRIGHKSGTANYLTNVANYYWHQDLNNKKESELKSLLMKKKGFLSRLLNL